VAAKRTKRTTAKKYRKPNPPPDWSIQFIKVLSLTANVRASCDAAQIGRTAVYLRRKEDPDFARAWEDAVEDAIDSLELAGYQRALDGSNDSLLMFFLKTRRRPVYGDVTRLEHTGAEGGPIATWTEQERLTAVARLHARVDAAAGVSVVDGQAPTDGSLLDGAGGDSLPGGHAT